MNYNMQPQPPMSLQTTDEKQTGMFLHLSQLLGLVIPFAGLAVPIALWQIKKDEIPALDAHGKAIVNWMFSSVIYAFTLIIFSLLLAALSGIWSVFFIGIFGVVGIVLMSLVFPIIGGIKANNGELWEYPLTIKFLK